MYIFTSFELISILRSKFSSNSNSTLIILIYYRDSLLDQLQQQIDDLALFLEEERLNHRDTRRKVNKGYFKMVM